MSKLKDTLKKVDSERVYSLTEIVKSGLIPFIKSYHTAYKVVLENQALPKTQRTLDASIIGEGKARTIRIKGKDLQKYLEANADRIS